MKTTSSSPDFGRHVYHELAHYYAKRFPRWFNEGWAEFLASYTLHKSENESIDSLLQQAQRAIGNECPSGIVNVQDLLDAIGPRRSGLLVCQYPVGESFLLALYSELGHQVVSSSLRNLYGMIEAKALGNIEYPILERIVSGEYLTESTIYEAFLVNVSPQQRDRFGDLYRRFHGRPILAEAGSPDRSALIAFYESTNGQGWRLNENWMSDRPIDSWFGVTIDGKGRVTGLELRGNRLNGAIPAEFANLTALQKADLSGNQLSGTIPPQLDKLAALEELNLGGNQLSGPVPPELGDLTALKLLVLSSNQLSGQIPAELGNMTSLSTLFLERNQLSGPIPAELGNMRVLTGLNLSNNQLNGPIPPEFGMSRILSLSLADNRLSGPIPAELGNMTNLFELDLSNNQLSGPILPEVGKLGWMRHLNLSGNELSGPVPKELGEGQLAFLHLNDNRLSGTISPELFGLYQLPGRTEERPRFTIIQEIHLHNNLLTGPIPDELGSEFNRQRNLKVLHLHGNQLSGQIPASLHHLRNLTSLSLRDNQLSGCLYAQLLQLNIETNDLDKLGLDACK